MTKGEDFRHVLATRNITEVICLSSKTSNNAFVFPLRLAAEGQFEASNLSPDFMAQLEAKLALEPSRSAPSAPGSHIGAEDAFVYIYAVLESTGYRERYAE